MSAVSVERAAEILRNVKEKPETARVRCRQRIAVVAHFTTVVERSIPNTREDWRRVIGARRLQIQRPRQGVGFRRLIDLERQSPLTLLAIGVRRKRRTRMV